MLREVSRITVISNNVPNLKLINVLGIFPRILAAIVSKQQMPLTVQLKVKVTCVTKIISVMSIF